MLVNLEGKSHAYDLEAILEEMELVPANWERILEALVPAWTKQLKDIWLESTSTNQILGDTKQEPGIIVR